MTHDTTTLDSFGSVDLDAGSSPLVDALVVLWCADEPSRVGEALLVPRGHKGESFVFGRGVGDSEGRRRLHLARQRPGENEATPPLETPRLSREQLVLTAGSECGLQVTNAGKRVLIVRGVAMTTAQVRPGELVLVGRAILFLCARRPAVLAPMRASGLLTRGAFGEADDLGYVGESPAAWRLRDEIGLMAPRPEHVLVLGESGAGKELVAQALHALSARGRRRLVARNAATVPAGIIDAEIFGSAANYPGSGMPERPGLVGDADGSTLYLDEVGELPLDLQTHFLRLLDGGDYQRLGDARKRTSDLRVVAATNRPVGQLRTDLAARFPLRIQVPGLHDRREDIPLLARHLLRKIWETSRPTSLPRHAVPTLSRELTAALVQHLYSTHTRELTNVLLRTLMDEGGPVLGLTKGAREMLSVPPETATTAAVELTREAIVSALAEHDGVRERVWRALGLPNRHVLKRLLKKHGIQEADGDDSA